MTSPKPETAHHITMATCACGTLTLVLRREDGSILATASIPMSGLYDFCDAILDEWRTALKSHPDTCGSCH